MNTEPTQIQRISFASLAVALALAACHGSAAQPDDSGVAADLAPSLDLGSPAAADLAAPVYGKVVSDALAQRVMGKYALQLKITSIMQLPILGKMPSTSTLLALAEIARDGAGLKITETGCHVDVAGASVVTTVVPDALTRSVPPSTIEFRVWEDAGAVQWQRPETISPIGVMLAQPATDPLPTMASDPRVWDQDQDGKPGVTIKLSGIISGDVYAVQSQRDQYRGSLSAQDQISGSVTDASSQSVIGASNAALNQNVMQAWDPDPAKNPVVFVKLTTAYDCDKLVADRATLFP